MFLLFSWVIRPESNELMASNVEEWMTDAACTVELPNKDLLDDDEYAEAYAIALSDVSFISKPDEVTERRWAKTCSRCPVFSECVAWADRTKASGIYVAGEWRE